MIYRIAKVLSIRDFGRSLELNVQVTSVPQEPLRLPADAEIIFPVGENMRATCYPLQVGRPEVGQLVRIECSAPARRLGTGGGAMVVSLEGENELPADEMPVHNGHIVKARYTPSQIMVSAVEEQDSPHHETMVAADDLDGTPVVAFDLHSQLPAVIAGIRSVNPQAKVAYVYTDAAALPAYFSRSVWSLREAGWLDSVITAGQAYGGDLEAVNVFSGMLAAKAVVGADVIVVGQGPGNAGTGTPYGYSGLELASVLNFAVAGGARALPVLRISSADQRERHWGLSHHSLHVLERFVPYRLSVPVPAPFYPLADAESVSSGSWPTQLELSVGGEELVRKVRAQLEGLATCHDLVPVDCETEVWELLCAAPCALRTMGRGLREDPFVFLAAACAGRLAMCAE